MAAFNKFNRFVEDLGKVLHDFPNDILKVLLTNTVPNAADTVVDTTGGVCVVKTTSNANEIAAGNGYTKGGNQAVVSSWGEAAGIAKLVLADPATWTAGPAAMATLRYAVLYNESKGAAASRPVVAWWDYGSSIAPNVGETFKVDFDPTTGVLTIT